MAPSSHCGCAPRREFRDGQAPLSIQRPCRAPLPLLAQIKMTPLHIASAKGEVASVAALLGCGANIEAKDQVSLSPSGDPLLPCRACFAETTLSPGGN